MRQRLNSSRILFRFAFLVRLRCLLIIVSAAVIAPVLSLPALGQTSITPSITKPAPRPSVVDPNANHPPDANDIQTMRDKQTNKQKFEAANLERMRQLATDSALLLKLAKELKSEMEANPNEALSDSMMKKAEEIERLARNVQVKMKLTVGVS
jgi:hypothetical protein